MQNIRIATQSPRHSRPPPANYAPRHKGYTSPLSDELPHRARRWQQITYDKLPKVVSGEADKPPKADFPYLRPMKLPYGQSNFLNVATEFYYVDRTQYIEALEQQANRYLVSCGSANSARACSFPCWSTIMACSTRKFSGAFSAGTTSANILRRPPTSMTAWPGLASSGR